MISQKPQFNAAQQESFTQQNAAIAQQQQQQEQQRRAEAKRNVRTVQEVESDQPSFLDQPLLLEGTIGMDNFYSYGYGRTEQTHYCFEITDSTGTRCHAYMEREKAGNLRQALVSAGSPLKGVLLWCYSVVVITRAATQLVSFSNYWTIALNDERKNTRAFRRVT